MNKIKCIIVDDEPIAQRILEGYIKELEELSLVGKCKHALEARAMLDAESVDLMLLDIEMPKLKGLNFLRTLAQPPAVIITTAHREFALEGFDLEVLDYLLKPIAFERFLQGINRYKKIHWSTTPTESTVTEEPSEFLYIKSNRKTVKIQRKDILFIEGMSNYVKIHTNKQFFTAYISLSNIQGQLDERFIRIHKSYIVNRKAIKAFTNEYLELEKRQLPIGKSYRKDVSNLL